MDYSADETGNFLARSAHQYLIFTTIFVSVGPSVRLFCAQWVRLQRALLE